MKKVLSLLTAFILTCGGMSVSADKASYNIKGDINRDGQLDIEDVSKLMLSINGITPLTDDEERLADYNEDGSIDIVDVVCIMDELCGNVRGVAVRPEPEPEPEPPKKPAPPVPAADGHFDTSYLSTYKMGWGHGYNRDSLNRSVNAVSFNENYGKYYAKAIDLDHKGVMLTFDEGYENGYTGRILDILKEKNVKATFFIVKPYAVENPELVQRMIDEGHTVGNHTTNHYSLPTLGQSQIIFELMDTHDYVKEHFDYEMTMMRPPQGEYSEMSLAVTANCGYTTYLWSWAHADWDPSSQPYYYTALNNSVGAASPGAIYLLHAVSKTNTDMLGEFIDGVRAKGFEFDTF